MLEIPSLPWETPLTAEETYEAQLSKSGFPDATPISLVESLNANQSEERNVPERQHQPASTSLTNTAKSSLSSELHSGPEVSLDLPSTEEKLSEELSEVATVPETSFPSKESFVQNPELPETCIGCLDVNQSPEFRKVRKKPKAPPDVKPDMKPESDAVSTPLSLFQVPGSRSSCSRLKTATPEEALKTSWKERRRKPSSQCFGFKLQSFRFSSTLFGAILLLVANLICSPADARSKYTIK